MATVIPKKINKFLGINESVSGSTELLLGEADIMYNWRITDDYKLKKLYGYAELFTSLGEYEIRGMWYGSLNGTYHFLFAANGNVYEHDFDLGTNTSIGTLTDAKTFIFYFGGKVYFQNGNEYKSWDGTTFGTVEGYIPKIYVTAPPAGGGTVLEPLNALTGKKHMTFSGDNTSTEYQLPETNIDSVDFVYVNGVLKTVTTDYTVNLTTGKITFVTAPDDLSEDNVDPYWTKGTGARDLIEKCRKALVYGGQNDTRVFVWGNEDYPNRRLHTGLANGIPSAEYFPVTNYYDIGTSEFEITDIVKQYDRQIIFNNGGQAFFSYYEQTMLSDDTQIVSFPVYPLNDTKGNQAFGQAQIILNNPFVINNGIYEFVSTTVRDERNVVYKSKRIQPSLDEVDLTTAITYDYEKRFEYWLCVDNTVWVYNYRIDVWYKFVLTDNPTCFIEIDKEMYFGTDNGEIMNFDDSLRSFNGADISSRWEMGFNDVDIEYLRKYLTYTFISLEPDARSSVDVYWETNKKLPKETPKTIGYTNLDFDDIDFDDFSFSGNYNPQPFRIKTKAKKWVYWRLILENISDEYTSHVLSINFNPTLGGYSK